MLELIKKHDKSIKVVLIIFAIILSVLYLKFFFQKGIPYDDVFLIQKETAQGIKFEGKTKSGDIKLQVKGEYLQEQKVYLDYQLPNNINRSYTVEFDIQELGYKDKVKILDDTENIIFNGFYIKNSDMIYLLDESEEMVFPDSVFYFSDGNTKTIYDSRYKISIYNIINLATHKDVGIRGSYPPFIFAIILLMLNIIDIKYPLFFFELNNYINVKNPEPSDFYLTVQRIRWYVDPIISLILLIVAIV